MSLVVNGKTIETDEEGYLVNHANWNQDVATAIAKAEKVDMTDSHWGLIEAAREHFEQRQLHLTGNGLVHILGKHLQKAPHDIRHNVNDYLYKLFPHSPEKQIAKIAGLPKLLPADTE
jgi:TusE/DsrC/DsvC family sulfur relay protein